MKALSVLFMAVLCFAFNFLCERNRSSIQAASPASNSTSSSVSEVNRSLTYRPNTLDPHLAGDTVSSEQVGMVYENLYEYDYFNPSRVVPCLAEELPEISEDGLTYTIRVKKGVLFQNDSCFEEGEGRELTAHDVIYSILRFASLPETPGWWTLVNQIVGLDTWRGDMLIKGEKLKPREVPTVEGLLATNDYTVQITLNKPDPRFLFKLCLSYTSIVPYEAVLKYGNDFASNPVGTGPYVLESYDPEKHLVWVKNQSYRDAYYPKAPKTHEYYDRLSPLEGRKLPLSHKVTYHIITEASDSWEFFLAGGFDQSGIAFEKFSSVIEGRAALKSPYGDDGRNLTLQIYGRPVLEYFSFNMDDDLVGPSAGEKGAAIRKAIGLSFDTQSYLDDYRDGRGSVARGFVPEGMTGYNPDHSYPWAEFDPEKARTLLNDAGYVVAKINDKWMAIDPATKMPLKVTILARGTAESSRRMAAAIERAGEECGITLVGELTNFPNFLRAQSEGTGQAYNAGWVLDYPDAHNILELLYGPQAREYGLNSTKYRSESYDKLFEEMASLSEVNSEDRAKKASLIQKMTEILEEDCPIVPLYWEEAYLLRHQWVYPTAVNDFSYNQAKYRYVDMELKESVLKEWAKAEAKPSNN